MVGVSSHPDSGRCAALSAACCSLGCKALTAGVAPGFTSTIAATVTSLPDVTRSAAAAGSVVVDMLVVAAVAVLFWSA